jgi:hypothetical protein
MTCCIVGKHPNIADIDRLIRAQQAASRANNATSVPSYSQIAKRFGLARPSLIRHRDECLSVDSGALSEVGSDGIANDSTTLTPAPPDVDRGVHARRGQATGPPSDGAERHGSVSDAAQSVPSPGQNALLRAAQHGAGVVGLSHGRGGEVVEGQWRPTERSRHPDPRARAREDGRRGWAKVANEAAEGAVRTITNAIADSEIADPTVRTHASYVQEIVEIIGRDEWDNSATVTRLARAWDRSQMFVLGCYRDACALRRMARGSPNEDREVSLVRWVNLYKIAIANGDALSLKVASDALKGYDAASGVVDKSTRVQVNIAQDPQAQELVRRILVTLQQFPDALAAVRSSLSSLGPDGDPTALLTTGEVAE